MKSQSQYQFHDLLPMTNLLMALLVAYLLVTLGYAALMLMELPLPSMGAVRPLAHRIEAGITVAGGFQSVLLLACVSGYLVWICRANNNVHALGAAGIKTPAWAVAGYLIPVANIGLGFAAMAEVWKASHNPSGWTRMQMPRWMALWWAAWLIANGVAGYDLISRHGQNYSWLDRNYALLVEQAFNLVAGVLLIVIVRRIAQLQFDSQAGRFGAAEGEMNGAKAVTALSS